MTPICHDLLALEGFYHVHTVDSLGNQQAVIDGDVVYVKDIGIEAFNQGVALAALGELLDFGYLAWPQVVTKHKPDF